MAELRQLISLVEHTFAPSHVWHGTSKASAKNLITHGIDLRKVQGGYFGYGFYVADTPDLAKSNYADFADDAEAGVVLEYRIDDGARILDLREEPDWLIWRDGRYDRRLHEPNLWRTLVHHGIDGVYDRSFEGICVYNKDVLTFVRVYCGVVDDPLSKTDTSELDEFALGGLKRCTAVTVNALLKDFHIPGILLSDVPVDNPGVLAILDRKGLAYKPFPYEVGKTVQQFVSMHKSGDWYLLTLGHAMALIHGELFDAENKGADGRKLQAAFQITRR